MILRAPRAPGTPVRPTPAYSIPAPAPQPATSQGWDCGIMEVMLGTVVHYNQSVGIMLFTFVFSAFVAERAHVPVEPVIVPEVEESG